MQNTPWAMQLIIFFPFTFSIATAGKFNSAVTTEDVFAVIAEEMAEAKQ